MFMSRIICKFAKCEKLFRDMDCFYNMLIFTLYPPPVNKLTACTGKSVYCTYYPFPVASKA